jgi:hypothetical protein
MKKLELHPKPVLLAGIILMSMLFQNCSPVFSELQGARTVGEGNVEFTPSYSTVSGVSEGESEKLQNQMGIHAAFGVSPTVDIRARYEYVWLEDVNTSVLALGPKIGIVKDKVAFSLPVGRALGEGTSDSWQIHPTVLLTLPAVKDKLDINLSPKYLITFCEECGDYFAVNLGLAISSDLNQWAIRPEYGLLYDLGESGHVGQFSIGFSKVFGNN